MRTKSIITLLLAVTLVAAFAFVAGCTGTETEKVTHLRIGYQPSTHQVAHMTAMAKGWWEDDLAPFGITEVTDYSFPTGPPEMQAMLGGNIDIAYVGAAPVISALATGLDAKIVAAVQTQGSDLVLRPEIPYTGPQDLKGLTIGTFPPGSIQDTLLREWLEENNLDPDKDVTLKTMGPGDATTAMIADQIDGAFLPHPAPAVIENKGAGKTVVSSGEMAPNHACCVLVASGTLIRDQPDLVVAIVKTHIKATDYNLKHPEEAAEIYSKKTGQDLADVKRSFAEWDGTWAADPNLIVDSVEDYARIQYELGYINKHLTKDDIFDLSFYEKARV